MHENQVERERSKKLYFKKGKQADPIHGNEVTSIKLLSILINGLGHNNNNNYNNILYLYCIAPFKTAKALRQKACLKNNFSLFELSVQKQKTVN